MSPAPCPEHPDCMTGTAAHEWTVLRDALRALGCALTGGHCLDWPHLSPFPSCHRCRVYLGRHTRRL